MKTQFEIGQKASLKNGLIEGENYGGITYWNEMKEALEENNTIEAIRKGKVYFKNNTWKYTEEMLENN